MTDAGFAPRTVRRPVGAIKVERRDRRSRSNIRCALHKLALLPLARRHGAQLLLNGDIDGALALGIGVQLKSAQLGALSERPLPWLQLVGASCHDAAYLAQATRIGADFATLSPVAATRSHPQTPPLGWPRFHSLAEAAALPVYALGGMAPSHITQARQCSGQGVAGIREFWS